MCSLLNFYDFHFTHEKSEPREGCELPEDTQTVLKAEFDLVL